jgi:hypothetical protein
LIRAASRKRGSNDGKSLRGHADFTNDFKLICPVQPFAQNIFIYENQKS